MHFDIFCVALILILRAGVFNPHFVCLFIYLFIYLFICLVVSWHGLQDLSSPTSDWTQAPAVKAPSPNHWPAREFPYPYFMDEETEAKKV